MPNRRFLRYRSVNEMLTPDGKFFEAKVVTLGGQQYSIADFERAFDTFSRCGMRFEAARTRGELEQLQAAVSGQR